jgi:hypothetical protein
MSTPLRTDDRDDLTGERFAYAHQRRLRLESAAQVRAAVTAFHEVEGASDADRDAAWARIVSAARVHGVDIRAAGWRELPRPGDHR